MASFAIPDGDMSTQIMLPFDCVIGFIRQIYPNAPLSVICHITMAYFCAVSIAS